MLLGLQRPALHLRIAPGPPTKKKPLPEGSGKVRNGACQSNRQTANRLLAPLDFKFCGCGLDIRDILALLAFSGDTNFRIGGEQPEINAATTTACICFASVIMLLSSATFVASERVRHSRSAPRQSGRSESDSFAPLRGSRTRQNTRDFHCETVSTAD